MSCNIRFTVVRNKKNNRFLCKTTYADCRSDVTHSTVTETEFDDIEYILDNITSNTGLIFFPNKDRALFYLKYNYMRELERGELEILSFEEISKIVEDILPKD